MKELVGYMVTWTTYGTWLQGDKRGYVDAGLVIKKNEQLRVNNENRSVKNAVRLGSDEQRIVENAIRNEANNICVELAALAVCTNHVHAVVESNWKSIEEIVSRFKNAGRMALKDIGISGKVWTKKYDKRFCYAKKNFQAKIAYVNKH